MAKVWSELSLFPHAGPWSPGWQKASLWWDQLPLTASQRITDGFSWVKEGREQEWISFLQDPDKRSALVSQVLSGH